MMNERDKELCEYISNDLRSMTVTLREFENGDIDAETFYRCIIDDAAEIARQAKVGSSATA